MVVWMVEYRLARTGQPRDRWLSRSDNAVYARLALNVDYQSASLAASSIIMASRFLASSSCRCATSAILRSR